MSKFLKQYPQFYYPKIGDKIQVTVKYPIGYAKDLYTQGDIATIIEIMDYNTKYVMAKFNDKLTALLFFEEYEVYEQVSQTISTVT